MYADKVDENGQRAPFVLGTSPPDAVVKAVFDAIYHDRPEIIVSSRPVRMLVAINAMSPRLGEWLLRKTKAHIVFESVAKASKNKN